MKRSGFSLLSCWLFLLPVCLLAAQTSAEPAREEYPQAAPNAKPVNAYAGSETENPSSVPPYASDEKGGGELNLSYQNFYNRINNSTLSNINGAAIFFQQFFPEHGLFSFRFEPITKRGGFATGANYLQWTGLPWKGRHWDFVLGDFHISTALQPTPFTNLVQPDFFVRGASVTMRTSNWRYSFYTGQETLSQGPRVPFRERVPQNTIGVEAAGSSWERLKIGFRYLHLNSLEKEMSVSEVNAFSSLGRRVTRSDSFTMAATTKLGKGLEWFTEGGWNYAKQPGSSAVRNVPFSFLTGPSWSIPHFTLRASYVSEGVGYLPILGYFLGDRRGENVDAVFQAGRLTFSGFLGRSRNNLERNPEVPDFSSRQKGGSMQIRLPMAFSLAASVSKLSLLTSSAGLESKWNDNLQFSVSLSRPLFRHTLRADMQQMDIQSDGSRQQLRLFEIEDTYNWSRFTVGGAVKWQHASSSERRSSVFLRGTAQVNFRGLSAYAHIEHGKDIANSTLFATSTVGTSVAGVSWEAPHKMSVQVEFLRNITNTNLNPASIFFLNGQGIPLNPTLARSRNWSIYVRLTRRVVWGERLLVDDRRGVVQRQASLTGTLMGQAKLHTMEGDFPAASISLTLDSGRETKTDDQGYFKFLKVPEGQHSIALNLDQLPADLNPSGQTEISVVVSPEKTTMVDFELLPLRNFTAKVQDLTDKPAPEGVVIRLLPVDRYTTTDQYGQFGFYNLPEGDYIVELQEKSLPEYGQLASARSMPVVLRHGSAPPEINFVYQIVLPAPKPIERILLDEHRIASSAPQISPARAVSSKAQDSGKK